MCAAEILAPVPAPGRALLESAPRAGATRVRTIKFKINGRCVRQCVFCPFHADPHRLAVEDIQRFFDLAGGKDFRHLVINGGEPTIHPEFIDICHLLKGRFRDRMCLSLGTNLIPFSGAHERCAGIRRAVFETFHRLEVGCDDEHRNIENLELMAPRIADAGVQLHVNVMEAYCGEATRRRILELRSRYHFHVGFSEVHHYYQARPVAQVVSVPCRKRTRDLLINCNGDAFFCYSQEMELPMFNLHSVTGEEMEYFLERHDPLVFHYCGCCPRYRPESLEHRIMHTLLRPFRKAPLAGVT